MAFEDDLRERLQGDLTIEETNQLLDQIMRRRAGST
jgi:hypothetical protein